MYVFPGCLLACLFDRARFRPPLHRLDRILFGSHRAARQSLGLESWFEFWVCACPWRKTGVHPLLNSGVSFFSGHELIRQTQTRAVLDAIRQVARL
jgi:hypothetical protein